MTTAAPSALASSARIAFLTERRYRNALAQRDLRLRSLAALEWELARQAIDAFRLSRADISLRIAQHHRRNARAFTRMLNGQIVL